MTTVGTPNLTSSFTLSSQKSEILFCATPFQRSTIHSPCDGTTPAGLLPEDSCASGIRKLKLFLWFGERSVTYHIIQLIITQRDLLNEIIRSDRSTSVQRSTFISYQYHFLNRTCAPPSRGAPPKRVTHE